MLNDQKLATTIVSIVWSLTVGGFSNPPSRPLAEPRCLGTSIDPETGTETKGPGSMYASAANAAVGERSTPSTGLSCEKLKSTRVFQ